MLTFEELRLANVKRCESPSGFDHPLGKWSVAEWGCAVSGEVGEACNLAKKLIRIRDGVPGNDETREAYVDKMAHEIADAMIYLDLWAASLNLSLEDLVRDAFNTKSKKIGYDGEI